jgi:argonaute-like protein implicated in RNA metabolism and viral defense
MKKRSGHLVYASVAQAYSTDVEPFALKGASVDHEQRRDRQPYLNETQAKSLLDEVLDQYLERAGVMPDRVVIHKTTKYQSEEIAGFKSAAKDRVATVDYIWMRSTAFRIVRKGFEEPWRGTLCTLKDQSYLFTGGYVPWWNEYPGMHIPAPIEIGSATQTDMKERSKEILTLTKMNWNSSDGISRHPITITFAHRVGELMCELSDNASPKPSYRFYI